VKRKYDVERARVLYSEAFKLGVVRELEESRVSFEEIRRKYGIGGCVTVQRWVRRYGNGTRGKVIRVETPEAIDEKEQLKRRVRALERALADTNIDLALERQYTRLACKRAGIRDVAEFKKKAAGTLPMGP
jgi:transposase-like protein